MQYPTDDKICLPANRKLDLGARGGPAALTSRIQLVISYVKVKEQQFFTQERRMTLILLMPGGHTVIGVQGDAPESSDRRRSGAAHRTQHDGNPSMSFRSDLPHRRSLA